MVGSVSSSGVKSNTFLMNVILLVVLGVEGGLGDSKSLYFEAPPLWSLAAQTHGQSSGVAGG